MAMMAPRNEYSHGTAPAAVEGRKKLTFSRAKDERARARGRAGKDLVLGFLRLD